MSTDVLGVVMEYVVSHDAQVRRNAATSLGVLGTPESVRALIQAALTDSDGLVRTHANVELGRLEGDARAHAVRILQEMLEYPQFSRRVYSLLGRLRHQGVEILPAQFQRTSLMRAALATLSLQDPASGLRIQWRSFLPGALGGLLGAIVVLTLFRGIMGIELASETIATTTFLGMLSAAVLTGTASQASNPVSLHFDRLVGSLRETLCAGLGGAIGGLALGAIVNFVQVLDEKDFAPMMHLAFVSGLLLAVSSLSRLGTILPLGFSRGYMNLAAGLVLGTVLGGSALTVGVVAAQSWDGGAHAEEASWYWSFLAPVPFALSLSFSLLEARSMPRLPIMGLAGRTAAYLAAGLLAVFILFVIEEPMPSGSQDLLSSLPRLPELKAEKATGTVTLNPSRLPVLITFEIASKQGVRATLRSEEQFTDLVLALFREGVFLESWDDPDPPTGKFSVDPGTYQLVAVTYDDPRWDALEPASSEIFLGRGAPATPVEMFAHLARRLPRVPLLMSAAAVTSAASEGGPHTIELSFGHRPGFEKSPDYETLLEWGTRPGLIWRGMKVRVRRPDDRLMFPSWLESMDPYEGKDLTVTRIYRADDHVIFDVAETPYAWNVEWIVDVKGP